MQRLLKTQTAASNLPEENPELYITTNLPVLSDGRHLLKLRRVIEAKRLELLFVDPVYLCLGDLSDKTSSVAVMGRMLRDFEQIGKETGCTLVLNHHTNRKHEKGKPLTLRDLSGAGFPEWARQWCLVCPRKDFDPETHQHNLWMVIGASMGHAGKYAVDVRERDDEGHWTWNASVRSMGEEIEEYKAAKEQAKTDRSMEFVNNLGEAIIAGVPNGGSTIRDLLRYFAEHGFGGQRKITQATLADFEDAGLVKQDTAKRGRGRSVSVWLPDGDWAVNTVATVVDE